MSNFINKKKKKKRKEGRKKSNSIMCLESVEYHRRNGGRRGGEKGGGRRRGWSISNFNNVGGIGKYASSALKCHRLRPTILRYPSLLERTLFDISMGYDDDGAP